MDAEVTHSIESETQFWDGELRRNTHSSGQPIDNNTELRNVFEKPCEAYEHIDDALRSFLALATQFKRTNLGSRRHYAKSTANV